MTKTTPPPAKHSRRTDLARRPLRWAIKGRTREGELYRAVMRQMSAHVGGKPTPAQELLIGRIAWLQVHLSRMDEKAMLDGDLSIHATREYLAWANALSRMLQALGLEAAPARPKTVDEMLAELHGRI